MSRRPLTNYVSVALLLAAVGWSAHAAAQIDYTAITVAPTASRQGAVLVGKVPWQCSGNRCTVSVPLTSPSVPFCRDLARTIGALRSFGNEKARLSAAQLVQCNEAGSTSPAVESGASSVTPTPPSPTPSPSRTERELSAEIPDYAGPWSVQYPDSERFIVLAQFDNEAVLDRETGLVWERTPGRFGLSWYRAMQTCHFSRTGGRMGWRLPAIEEMESLLVWRRYAGDPSFPVDHPFNLAEGRVKYWTASTWASAQEVLSWSVFMPQSNSIIADPEGRRTELLAWCVRGGRGYDDKQ